MVQKCRQAIPYVSSTAHKINPDFSEINVEVVAKVEEYTWRTEVNFKMARQLQITAYRTLRRISYKKDYVPSCNVQTETQLNSAKRASICVQRQRPALLNGRRQHFLTETCGICVRFVVRHYKPQTQIPAA